MSFRMYVRVCMWNVECGSGGWNVECMIRVKAWSLEPGEEKREEQEHG